MNINITGATGSNISLMSENVTQTIENQQINQETNIDWQAFQTLIAEAQQRAETPRECQLVDKMMTKCGKQKSKGFLRWLNEHKSELLSGTMQNVLGTALVGMIQGLLGM